jgi:hypothetical protein
VSGVPSLKESLRQARKLGLQVELPNATGEVTVRDPLQPNSKVRLNNRRKDSPRALLVMLKRAAELRSVE